MFKITHNILAGYTPTCTIIITIIYMLVNFVKHNLPMTFLIFKVKLHITNMLPSWMLQLRFGWDKVGGIIVKTVHVIEKETYSEEGETIDVF